MYIYGLDLSLSNTGIAIFTLEYQPVHITSIKTNSKHSRGKRLNVIRDKFIELTNTYKPETIVIEQGFSRFNKETHAIQNVVGVVLELLNEYEPVFYAATTIKATIAHGRAEKDLIRKIILKAYPDIVFKNNDESDAVGCILTHGIKTKQIKWDKAEIIKKKT